MKTVYFEFPDSIVDLKLMPSKLCYVIGREHDSQMFGVITLADRAYYYEGNKQVEIKNRYGTCGTMLISDEDKVVLKLKAVPL